MWNKNFFKLFHGKIIRHSCYVITHCDLRHFPLLQLFQICLLYTSIQVVYEEYETNEIMYPKVQSGAISYDVVCPSDYMIQRMIENDLLAEINWDNIPNIKNIGQTYMDQSKAFDPENKYSVPYCWGTVGILYNKTMVDEPIDSWSVLWDPKYKDLSLIHI